MLLYLNLKPASHNIKVSDKNHANNKNVKFSKNSINNNFKKYPNKLRNCRRNKCLYIF